MFHHNSRHPFPHYLFHFFYRSRLQAGYRFKFLKKFFDGFWSNAFDMLQFGGDHRLRPFVAVERDTETVRLVAHLLYQFEAFRTFI